MVTRLFFMIMGVILVTYVYSRVRKNLFSEKESMFWMIGSVFIFAISIYPKIVDHISIFLGINYPPSLLFLIAMLFILFLLLRQSQQISIINQNFKELVQRNALLEQKVRELNDQES